MKVKLQNDWGRAIQIYRNTKFPLYRALMEMIDNSIDANASEVSISQAGADLLISDNGSGFENPEIYIGVGQSSKDGGDIGRWGIGLKDASIKYSESTEIFSGAKHVLADWSEMINTGEEAVDLFEHDHTPGTLIRWNGFTQRYRGGIDSSYLAHTYAPILGQSFRLSVNGLDIMPLKQPDYIKSIERTVKFRGRFAKITGGIYKPNDPNNTRMWRGYNCYYKGRLIGPGKIMTAGVGEEGCDNFCFIVELIDGDTEWILDRHKEEAEEMECLLDYIYDTLTRPLLEEAAEQFEILDLHDFTEEIEALLNGDYGNQTRTEKRGKKGTVKPTDTGKKKEKTKTANDTGEYTQDDDDRKSKNRTPKRIQFKMEELYGNHIGEAVRQKKWWFIKLNMNNAFIRKHHKNKEMVIAMVLCVYSIGKQVESIGIDPQLLVSDMALNISREVGKELEAIANKTEARAI